MYVPKHFQEDDQHTLQQYIRHYGLGLLIVADGEGIEANHLPFFLASETRSFPGVLQCHVARNNSVWKRLENGTKVLVVFQGPDAYISPTWYPSKKESGKVVPTWNYLAIHAHGRARVIEDTSWLKRHLQQLTDQHEAAMDEPWAVDDAPADFTERLLQAIVGIEITIESLSGKLKASQNQTEQNRKAVKAALEKSEGLSNRVMAELMR